jgi:Helix-turn-helix
MDQGTRGCKPTSPFAAQSITVDRLPTRTVAPHGITGPELERFGDAVHFMGLYCQPRRSGLWWLSTDKGTSRSTVADIQKRATRLQIEYSLRPYNLTAFETRGGLHAHIVFLGNSEIARRLKNSAAFGKFIKVDPVTDPEGLAKYLAKERTPQAGYRRQHVLGGRVRGSHRLDGGGDRVRLSRDLERDAIAAGNVEPWQHTNARRSAGRKPYRLRRLYPRRAPRLAGQLALLDLRPVSRLRDFGGGIVPPAVAVEIEFRRRQRGLTQRELATLIGRSQGQLANALRGHDPISGTVINRLREALLT